MADQKSASHPLDKWLAGLSHDLPDGEVAGYVALGSGAGGAAGFAIVKLPSSIGPAAIGRHMEDERLSVSERISRALQVHAQYAQDLERALQEKSDYVDELVMERERAEEREAATRLENKALSARVDRLQQEMREYRSRAAIAEGLAVRAENERDQALARVNSDQDVVRLAELEDELAAARSRIEQLEHKLREADKKAATGNHRADTVQAEFDEFREQSIARAARRQREAAREQSEALDEATGKLLGTRVQLRRSEERIGELQAKLRQTELELAKLQLAATSNQTGDEPDDAGAPGAPGDPDDNA